jgi:hypothetical protein
MFELAVSQQNIKNQRRFFWLFKKHASGLLDWLFHHSGRKTLRRCPTQKAVPSGRTSKGFTLDEKTKLMRISKFKNQERLMLLRTKKIKLLNTCKWSYHHCHWSTFLELPNLPQDGVKDWYRLVMTLATQQIYDTLFWAIGIEFGTLLHPWEQKLLMVGASG